jgi:hypothetical protein
VSENLDCYFRRIKAAFLELKTIENNCSCFCFKWQNFEAFQYLWNYICHRKEIVINFILFVCVDTRLWQLNHLAAPPTSCLKQEQSSLIDTDPSQSLLCHIKKVRKRVATNQKPILPIPHPTSSERTKADFPSPQPTHPTADKRPSN